MEPVMVRERFLIWLIIKIRNIMEISKTVFLKGKEHKSYQMDTFIKETLLKVKRIKMELL
jgi:hypothetical protein